MDLRHSTAENAFRAEVQAWFGANLPPDLPTKVLNHRSMSTGDYLRSHKNMAGRAWAGSDWPMRWGGMDRTATDQHIFDVDYGRRRPANRTVRRGGGSAGKFLDKTASDLHGSKGMADDLTLGHDFKRLAMIDAMLGDTDHPVAAFAALADAA